MSIPNFANRTIWVADCLDIMRGMNSDCVDLVYLDPPFNSKHNYSAPIGSKAAGAAFKDTWSLADVDVEWVNLIEAKHPALHRVLLAAQSDSDKSYLVYMAARLLEVHRVLKPTGSVYLHCDPTMSHYLKLVMDSIWGQSAFRNEIIWAYRGGGVPKYDFARKHDVLLRYSNSDTPTFNVDDVRIPYSDDVLKSSASRYDKSYRSNKVYSGYRPNKRGKHPEDWWAMQAIMPSSKERVGYPTQKPLALLERVIKASSNEDDVVLDPFCGCATTCVAAERLDRKWAGIDLSSTAAQLVQRRARDELGIMGGLQTAVRTDIPKRTDLGKLPRYNSTANKRSLYGQQAGNCEGCGTHFEMRNLEVDHIIPRSKGGTDHLSNLQLLCGSCDRIKGNRGMEYLRVKLQLR